MFIINYDIYSTFWVQTFGLHHYIMTSLFTEIFYPLIPQIHADMWLYVSDGLILFLSHTDIEINSICVYPYSDLCP